MLGNLKLTKNPVHHQQPCSMSCVPTCLAMAFGVNPKVLIADMAELGIGINKGVTRRVESFYLSHKGIGYERFLGYENIGIGRGHYLAEIVNTKALMHCIYLYVKGDEIVVFDPNKDGSYLLTAGNEPRIRCFTRLDDFSDLIKPTPPTEEPAE